MWDRAGVSAGKGAMGERDFFISYTQADRGWAEWIGWVLEEDGYRVLIQAWDFVPGSNWMIGMQAGARDASRTIAVLSPAYLDSVYGGAEWQAAIAGDPDGTRRKLLVVRVSQCERPGLLAAVVGVDLFGIPEAEARERLRHMVIAAEAGRMKPSVPPSFPGRPAPVLKLLTPAEPEPESAPAERRPDLRSVREYRPEPTDPPSGGPLFFFSHAPSSGIRGARRGDAERFFRDLSENVSNLVSLPARRDPGFIDSELEGGIHWWPQLAEALGTCQVFIALLSARYLSSEWCGKEWDGFAQRVVRERGFSDHHTVGMTCIIPVMWAPFPRNRVPHAVAGIQWFSPLDLSDEATADLYHEEGILGLLQSGRDQAYQAVAWQLAKRIAEIQERYEVVPQAIDGAVLRNAFG